MLIGSTTTGVSATIGNTTKLGRTANAHWFVLSLVDYLSAAGLEGTDLLPNADPDRDGHPNVFEYLAQTDPSDKNSQPATILSVSPSPSGATFELHFELSPQAIGYSIAIETSASPHYHESNFSEAGSINQTFVKTFDSQPLFARLVANKQPAEN